MLKREPFQAMKRDRTARRLAATAIGLVSVLSLAACNGSDETDTSEASTGSEAENTAAGDIAAPDATLPKDFPEEARDGWAPIEFSGKQLPPYDSAADPDPAIGQAAPTFVGYDINDQVVEINPADQGKTMIVMVSHWCPNCNNEVPEIVGMYKDGEIPEDVNVYAVLTGSRLDSPGWPPDEWIRKLGWPYESIFDGVVRAQVNGETRDIPASQAYYGFEGVPSVVLVDGDGNVVDRWSGAIGREQMTQRLTNAFAESADSE